MNNIFKKFAVGIVFLATILSVNYVLYGNPTKASSTTGEQKTLVVMINFSNTTAPSLTKATVDDIVFNQVDAYYRENSYNKVFVTGDSYGWLTVPYLKTCDRGAMLNYALEAVAPLTDITQYDHLFITGPFDGCGFAAWSGYGKSPISTPDGTATLSRSWINAITFGPGTITHEFGHGLGLDHANFYNCGSVSIVATGCSSVEYGDPYDILAGPTNRPHMNAGHKDLMGWFDANTMATVTESGRYIIEPIETATGNLKAIRIPRSASDYLYVEYRQPIGFDVGMPANSDIYQGALLHIGQFKTNLIDASPPTSNLNPVLHAGQTLIDPKTQSSVTVVEVVPEHITVDVVVGRSDFIAPTVAITSPVSGQVISGQVSIQADAMDSSGIEKVEFYVNGQLVGVDLDVPYETTWDSKTSANGTGTVYALAYDNAGLPWGQSNNVGYSSSIGFTINNIDEILPTISFLNAQVQMFNPVHLDVSATDNMGISLVNFSVDGTHVNSNNTSPYSFEQELVPGQHTITAQAQDLVGNLSVPASISIEVLAPTIQIVNPLNNSIISDMVNIVAETSKPSAWVQLFIDGLMSGNLIASNGVAQRTIDFSTYPANSVHEIKVTTSEAGYLVSDAINITVADTKAPVLSITSPVANASVSGSVSIDVFAQDDDEVSKVEFYIDGSLLNTDSTAPYSVKWDTSSLTHDSSHTILVKAYDSANNTASQTVGVKVLDITAPTLSITYPLNGGTVPRNSNITVSATSSDVSGVGKVEFYINNTLKCSDTATPYSCVWKVPAGKSATHTIMAKSYDVAGNITQQAISVVSK